MYNPFSLKSKTILVTGASSGIGRATAIECSRLGATLCITGRNQERLNETLRLLQGKGHFCQTADLTIESDVVALVENLLPIDGIVHAAGVIIKNGILAIFSSSEQMQELMRVNFFSIVRLNSLIYEKKKFKPNVSIVHIGSLSVQIQAAGIATYAATKSALLQYSRHLALEMGYKKMRVNVVLPGIVQTDVIKNMTQDEDFYIADRQRYLLDYGQPVDVAWMCVYLLSDASRWVTGSEFVLDGGRTLK